MYKWFRYYRQEIQRQLALGIPMIVGQVGTILMGITDTAMIGQVGATELAASGIANAIFFLVGVIGIGTLFVLTPMVSSAKGADDAEACGAVFKNGMVVSTVLGLVLAIAIYILTFYFEWFGQSPAVSTLAINYLYIVALSILPMLWFLTVRSFTDGLSMVKIAMYATVAGLILNIFLNWLLIYGHVGLPALGLEGAGYATFISRVAMALGMWWYVYNHSSTRAFLPSSSKVSRQEILKIFKLGLPGGMQFFFEAGAFSGASVVIGWLGTIPLAAHNVVISVASFTYMVSAGVASAAAIRVGEAIGEGNKTQVLHAGRAGFVMVLAFTSFCCISLLILDEPIISIFNQDPGVLAAAIPLMFWAALFQMSDGTQVVALSGLRALSDVQVPTAISLVAYWVIGLPLGYLFGFYLNMGATGVWIGLSAGLAFSAVFMTLRFFRTASRLKT